MSHKKICAEKSEEKANAITILVYYNAIDCVYEIFNKKKANTRLALKMNASLTD
jgi:hypothetical protein